MSCNRCEHSVKVFKNLASVALPSDDVWYNCSLKRNKDKCDVALTKTDAVKEEKVIAKTSSFLDQSGVDELLKQRQGGTT
jgi:hypothetical protein